MIKTFMSSTGCGPVLCSDGEGGQMVAFVGPYYKAVATVELPCGHVQPIISVVPLETGSYTIANGEVMLNEAGFNVLDEAVQDGLPFTAGMLNCPACVVEFEDRPQLTVVDCTSDGHGDEEDDGC